MLIENNKGNKGLQDLLQNQVEHEFENERLYLSMALWCEKNNFPQTAKFFSEHALEERAHGMDFINAMIINSFNVDTPYTTDIPRNFSNLKDVLIQAVDKEKETSSMIAKIHKVAINEASLISDVTTKYIHEQVEETQLFLSLLKLYELCEDSKIDFEMEIMTLRTNDKYKIGNL